MSALQTIPTMQQLSRVTQAMPNYMVPNMTPYAVVMEEHLSPVQCDSILRQCALIPSHSFHGCNARTRDLPRPLPDSLQPILDALLFINEAFYHFDINAEEPAAWMQTYGEGNDYKRHTDAAPGQSRKLTAVAMLSEVTNYAGGHLVFDIGQKEIAAPSKRGTIIVFPAWITHRVTPIDLGTRQTINLGVWGPPFR